MSLILVLTHIRAQQVRAFLLIELTTTNANWFASHTIVFQTNQSCNVVIVVVLNANLLYCIIIIIIIIISYLWRRRLVHRVRLTFITNTQAFRGNPSS